VFWLALAALGLVAGLVMAGLWQLAHARAWLRPAERLGPRPAVVWALAMAACCAAVLVVVLLARAWQTEGLLGADRVAAAWARDAYAPGLAPAVRFVTHLADPLSLWAAAGVLALLLWRRHERALAIAWLAALGGNALLNPALKRAFERLRPEADLSGLVAHGYSFPSGHTSGAVVAFGMAAYLGWRLLPGRWQLPACLLAVVAVLLVGASRIWLQVHYLSDVLAGIASGGAWLALCIAAAGTWRVRGTGGG
jgi:membrane-associated phospholipid phosphatase